MYVCTQLKGHTCRYVLPSGIWLKPTDQRRPKELDHLSKELDFIIAVFDANVAHGFMQTPVLTPESLSLFLLRIVGLLEQNQRWGAIIKCKHQSIYDYEDILQQGGEIVARMRSLNKQNRLVELQVETSPITASENSDLAVCYAFNSAGIVSGIYGYRAILWDCLGIEHPFYGDPDQKIVYRSLDELEGAIYSASQGDTTIGDFTKWRQEYNYFLDYQGDKRIGWFVQAFMEEIGRTNDAETALDLVVKRYIGENQIGDEFFRTDQDTFGFPPATHVGSIGSAPGCSSC